MPPDSELWTLGRVRHPFPPIKVSCALNHADGSDAEVIGKLRESVGDFFAERMVYDSVWARGVLGDPSSDDMLIRSWHQSCSTFDRSAFPRTCVHALISTIIEHILVSFPAPFRSYPSWGPHSRHLYGCGGREKIFDDASNRFVATRGLGK